MTLFLTVFAGALLAGFVHGLVGFGTGLVALGLWLHVLEPVMAAPLVAICSVAASTQSIHVIRHAISLRRLWPFILFGLPGVPLGVLLLGQIDATALRAAVGIFLVLYSTAMLRFRRLPVIRRGGRPADALVGFAGGIMGGAGGLSGALPTVWCGLKGWSKEDQRATLQPFNMTILAWTLISYASQGIMTGEVGRLALAALPGTLIGVWFGVKTYGRINDRQFQLVILWLLLTSGMVLTATNLL